MSKRYSLEELVPVMEETLNENGEVSFVSAGTSMMPTIRDRKDTVTLVKPNGKLKKGDVPFYRRDNGQYILHRIVYVNGDTYVTCGDNQWVNEYNVRQDQVIGVLKSIERNGKVYSVNDGKYKAYLFFLPAVRWAYRLYNAAKRRVRNFINYLFKR